LEKPEWFLIEMIPDVFLPMDVIVEEGGADRRRSSLDFPRLIFDGGGTQRAKKEERRVHPSE